MSFAKRRPKPYREEQRVRCYITTSGDQLFHIRVCVGAYGTRVFDCGLIENWQTGTLCKCSKCGREFKYLGGDRIARESWGTK